MLTILHGWMHRKPEYDDRIEIMYDNNDINILIRYYEKTSFPFDLSFCRTIGICSASAK